MVLMAVDLVPAEAEAEVSAEDLVEDSNKENLNV
jgi:hypothetical protein